MCVIICLPPPLFGAPDLIISPIGQYLLWLNEHQYMGFYSCYASFLCFHKVVRIYNTINHPGYLRQLTLRDGDFKKGGLPPPPLYDLTILSIYTISYMSILLGKDLEHCNVRFLGGKVCNFDYFTTISK